MLAPKRAKYRTSFRGRREGISTRGTRVSFGEYALQALSNGWVSSRQIEAARKAMTHYTKKGGRVWIRIFPDKPVSKKPPEVRMGGGKGETEKYVAVIRAGRVLFEMGGVTPDGAKEALTRAGAKLALATRFITKAQQSL